MELFYRNEFFYLVQGGTSIKSGEWYLDVLKDELREAKVDLSADTQYFKLIASTEEFNRDGVLGLDTWSEFKYYDCWITLNNLPNNGGIDIKAISEKLFPITLRKFDDKEEIDILYPDRSIWISGYKQALKDHKITPAPPEQTKWTAEIAPIDESRVVKIISLF